MIIFTSHSLLKLEQRKISKIKVIKTIKQPDHIINGCIDRKIVFRKFNKLYLKVIYKKENGNIIVVTQYFTSKFK